MSLDFENTKILYLSIYLLTTIFAFKSQTKIGDYYIFHKKWFVLSFLIHSVFIAISFSGVDYEAYYRMIEKYNLAYWYEHLEFIYYFLGYLFYLITENIDASISCIKVLSLCIIYYAIYRLRFNVSIGFAILSYNAFLYIQSYLVIAHHLAIAILILSLTYLIENKDKKAFSLYMLTPFVHASSAVFVPIYLIYYLYKKKNKVLDNKIIIIIIIACVSVVAFSSSIFNYAINKILLFSHYSIYNVINKGIGVGQIINFLPLFYIIMKYKKLQIDNNINNLFILYLILGFTCSLLGYKIEVMSRINVAFIGLYLIIVPYCLNLMGKNQKILFFIWFLYLVFRGYLVFEENLNIISKSGLQEYKYFVLF